MQVRSAHELMGWRLKGGMTKAEAHAIEVGRANGHPANTGVIQLQYLDGRPPIFRMLDEPSYWRWLGNCELVPSEELPSMLHGRMDYLEELVQRKHLGDREAAKEILADVIRSHGAAKTVEQRGGYALVSIAGMYDVTHNGLSLLPSPTGEAVAREVFEALAPSIVTPADTTLAAELAA